MRIIAVLAACAVLLVGCGNDAGSGTGAPSVTESTSPSEPPSQTRTGTPSPSAIPTAATPVERTGTVIESAKSEFGEILFDGAGQAIYLFDKEATPTLKCYDDCAQEWPPVLTEGDPVAAANVLAGPRHDPTDGWQQPGHRMPATRSTTTPTRPRTR